jgi:hypothetical protein
MLINQIPVFLSSQGEDTLWGLIKEVIDDFFSLDLGNYQNLGIPDSMLSGLRGVIVAFYLGVILASFAAVFNKKAHGGFVRTLIECGCNSPENAKTLSELGLERSALVKAAIKSKSAYHGILFCVEKEEYDKKVTRGRSIYLLRAAEEGEKQRPYEPASYQYDFSSAHFYIPDALRYEAEFRFQKKGSGIGSAIFITLASVVLMWATIKIAPDILQFFDNFMGGI